MSQQSVKLFKYFTADDARLLTMITETEWISWRDIGENPPSSAGHTGTAQQSLLRAIVNNFRRNIAKPQNYVPEARSVGQSSIQIRLESQLDPDENALRIGPPPVHGSEASNVFEDQHSGR